MHGFASGGTTVNGQCFAAGFKLRMGKNLNEAIMTVN